VNCFKAILKELQYAGSIRHSQTGSIPTVVLGYIHRPICTNVVIQRICLADKPARTKRSNVMNSKEPGLNAIREEVEQLFSQLHDRRGGIKQLTEHRLIIDGLIEGLHRRWPINKRVPAKIIISLHNRELGRTYSEFDMVKAISWVATHNNKCALRYDRRFFIETGVLAQQQIYQYSIFGVASMR
jgi:hypothetical protein